MRALASTAIAAKIEIVGCSHNVYSTEASADGNWWVERMEVLANGPAAPNGGPLPKPVRGRLFGKYVALFLAVVGLALVPKGILDIWFSYHQLRTLLVRIQVEQAKSAADKIAQYVVQIEGQMSWMTQLPLTDKSDDDWRYDAVRLLRQAPALTEVTQLDGTGRERYRMSRQAMDIIGSRADFSHDAMFIGAMVNKIYHGPVYFLHGSEPYMTIAIAGAQPDDGVVVAQVNLTFIGDVVSNIKVGKEGYAYVVDARGQLIAHPDISLVLRKTDLSHLAQVQAARASRSAEPSDYPSAAIGPKGRKVLTAYAPVTSLGWLVFSELPTDEAYAPLYAMLIHSALLALAGLALAFFAGLFLARRMIVPIRALQDGAARIGSGDLSQRISIETGDELEALGKQFNNMAAQLQDLYGTLEGKVEERTHQLEIANLAKSRFLAVASHDLRQPLHALGLFVAQLHSCKNRTERSQLIGRIDAALSAMNELFSALLDISKLDAGALTPNIAACSAAQLLKRVETTFAGAAREKGLSLRVVASSAWVRSDFILLERIVFNLVSNAVRYTNKGRIVIGCRSRDEHICIEVWDTGAGVPADQQENIFGEFYRLGEPDRDTRAGLGLGLAIVDRLCRLLDHPVHLKSIVGKGSCFSVTVPRIVAPAGAKQPTPVRAPIRMSNGKLVAVIDDDPLVLEGMGGLLRSWGYRVITGASDNAALVGLRAQQRTPDLIISDYRLPDGKTGIEVIERLRSTLDADIPAFLLSGDTNPELLQDGRINGYHLLHKPVNPMVLRALVTQVLKTRAAELAPEGIRKRSRLSRQIPFASSFVDLRQLPAQVSSGENRFGAIGDFQRLENSGDMIFHGWFGQIERAADQFVVLALHHQCENVELAIRQSQIGK